MTRVDERKHPGSTLRSRAARWAAPALVTALMTLGIGWLARAPYQPPGADGALLRLSWRMRAPAADTCRPRTQAELDALPVHMRSPEVCETHSAAWDLIVQLDSLPPDTTRVLQGGAKGDRPLFVLREVSLEPGAHRVRIGFAPGNDTQQNGSAAPLALDTVLYIMPGDVALVTLEPLQGTFVVRRSIQATKGMTE